MSSCTRGDGAQAGYATHHVGKWDAGMATPTHTPRGRGYDSSLNYFGHGNWAWSEGEWGGSTDHQQAMPTPGFADLWDTDGPARSLRGTGHEELPSSVGSLGEGGGTCAEGRMGRRAWLTTRRCYCPF